MFWNSSIYIQENQTNNYIKADGKTVNVIFPLSSSFGYVNTLTSDHLKQYCRFNSTKRLSIFLKDVDSDALLNLNGGLFQMILCKID